MRRSDLYRAQQVVIRNYLSDNFHTHDPPRRTCRISVVPLVSLCHLLHAIESVIDEYALDLRLFEAQPTQFVVRALGAILLYVLP